MKIIFKNRDFLVVDKDAGVGSQSDLTGGLDAVAWVKKELKNTNENDNIFVVHRLDRVVGGVLVFARNKNAASELSRSVAVGKIKKEYIAIVEGTAPGGKLQDFLYHDKEKGKAFVVDKARSGVKEAVLEYDRIDETIIDEKVKTLVKINLITGRFHQIRAQFSSRKLPLIGDGKYGSRDSFARYPALYAYRIEFDFKGKRYAFSSLPSLDSYPWLVFSKSIALLED